MGNELITQKKKILGLSYAFTDNGIELPVLDITHPLFVSSINEKKLEAMGREAAKKAKSFKEIPAFYKNFLTKRSFIMAGFLLKDTTDTFLNGMSTLMIKLGPGLIGGGRKLFFDRLAVKGFSPTTIRMRVRDTSKCQAERLIPQLKRSPGKNLCFINIAGGAGSDSINALILIQQEEPSLLENRKIEINVLDLDKFGPNFAARCVEALKAPDGRFHKLDINFRHIQYDWNDPAKLGELLSQRQDWLLICTSEGGLFEYGSDEAIIRNLKVLYDNSTKDMIIVSDIMHDINRLNPAIRAMMELTGIKVRLLGMEGLKNLLAETKWKLDRIVEGNPTYLVFILKKDS